MWGGCRSGMGGYAQMPDPGGFTDQAAWTMDAFGILAGVDHELNEKDTPR